MLKKAKEFLDKFLSKIPLLKNGKSNSKDNLTNIISNLTSKISTKTLKKEPSEEAKTDERTGLSSSKTLTNTDKKSIQDNSSPSPTKGKSPQEDATKVETTQSPSFKERLIKNKKITLYIVVSIGLLYLFYDEYNAQKNEETVQKEDHSSKTMKKNVPTIPKMGKKMERTVDTSKSSLSKENNLKSEEKVKVEQNNKINEDKILENTSQEGLDHTTEKFEDIPLDNISDYEDVSTNQLPSPEMDNLDLQLSNEVEEGSDVGPNEENKQTIHEIDRNIGSDIKKNSLNNNEVSEQASKESNINDKNAEIDILEEMASSRENKRLRKRDEKMNSMNGPLEGNLKKLQEVVVNIGEEKNNDKLDFYPPPNYDKIGRGLVYNCKQMHWACLDKSEFFQCKNNQLWSRQNKKPPSCVIYEVYLTNDDCNRAQTNKVNEQAATTFCETN